MKVYYSIPSPLAHRVGAEVAVWTFGSEDPGSIPGIPSPLMARRLNTSSDVPVPVSR